MTVTVSQIQQVQNNLPADVAENFNWSEDKIVTLLEVTNGSLAQTVKQFWLERVTESFEFVDVSETGSSRSLSQIYANAKTMLDYWDKQVEAEGLISLRRPISFGSIDST